MDCVCTRAACQDSREARRRTGSGGHLAKHSKRNVVGPVARKQQPYIMPKAICQPECLIWGSSTVICRSRRSWRDKLVTQTFHKYTAKLSEVRLKGQEVRQTSAVWLPVLHPGVRLDLSSLFHSFQLGREKGMLWLCALFWQNHRKVYCLCLHVLLLLRNWGRSREQMAGKLQKRTEQFFRAAKHRGRSCLFWTQQFSFFRVFKCWSRLL